MNNQLSRRSLLRTFYLILGFYLVAGQLHAQDESRWDKAKIVRVLDAETYAPIQDVHIRSYQENNLFAVESDWAWFQVESMNK